VNLIQDQLRAIIVECLRKDRPYRHGQSSFSVSQLLGEVAAIAKDRQLKYTESLPAWKDNAGRAELHANLRGPVWDIVWDLIVEGILRPGDPYGEEFGLPLIHVTAYGKGHIHLGHFPLDGANDRCHELTTAPGPILPTGGIAFHVMLFLTFRSSRRGVRHLCAQRICRFLLGSWTPKHTTATSFWAGVGTPPHQL
jgi:hypothetical protein